MTDSFLAQLDALISGSNEPEAESTQTDDVIHQNESPSEQYCMGHDNSPKSQFEYDPCKDSCPEEQHLINEERLAIQDETVELVNANPAIRRQRLELDRPIVGAISTEKMTHGDMVLNGICTKCVRCCFKLTDAVSIERGMGPECSSKGYAEDPTNPDEMGAMIELSQYPVLVEFLTQHYKPLGVRGLMNGLVRVAALNRKSPVHTACANAIEALGYIKLAAALRDALIIMKVTKSARHPGHLKVWVRSVDYTREWSQACYKHIDGVFYDRVERGLIVPDAKPAKAALWRCMMRHYAGECAATPTGTVRIPTEEEWIAKRSRKSAGTTTETGQVTT
jgi:hypothetical protein